MYDDKKIIVECQKFNIELSEYNDDKIWFSVKKDGATAQQPYGAIEKKKIKELIKALQKSIK